MKKLFGIMMIALMGVFMIGCSGGGSSSGSTEGSGSSGSAEVVSKAKEIFEGAKDKLATMPKDELKATALEFGEAIKPILTKSMEIGKKILDDGIDLEDVAKEYEKANINPEDVQTINGLVTKFTDEVGKNPAWAELQADEDFNKKWVEALGMGDILDDISGAVDDAAAEMEEGTTE